MAKLVLNNATGLTSINANFDAIEAEFQNKVLYRNNPIGEPNEMQSTLDMNENRIINLPAPISPSEPARIQDVLDNVVTYPSIYDEGVLKTVSAKTINFVGTNVTAGALGFDATVTVTSDLPTLAAPGGAALIGNTPAGNISATTVQAAINELDSEKISLSTLSPSSGSSLIGFTQGGTGSVTRTVQDKLRETVTLKDFGAVGDGVANDTNAVLAARDYMIASGNNVLVTAGTYLCDPFSVNQPVYALQADFVGTDRERCILKRRTTGAGAFFTLGSVSGTSFQSGVGLKNLTLDGGVLSNGDTFLGFDVVRTTFENVKFTGGAVGVRLYGGVSVNFVNCLAEASIDGYRIDKFTSLAGGGWPNLIRITGGEIVDCPGYGLYFDNGRMLIMDGVEVENNGTTLAALQGGVYVGPGVGSEVSVSDTYSIGLVANNCWFEANKGRADIVLEQGINSITSCNFFSTPAQTTNDILVNGGRYTVRECNSSFSKTNNLFENSGALAGNIITGSDVPNLSIDQAKTTVFSANKIFARNGVVPIFTDLATPVEQFGNNSTPGGGTVDITFVTPFASGSVPRVFVEVNNGDTATTINYPVISNLTRFGFRVRILSISNGSSTIASVAAGFNWRAIGTL